MLRRFTFLLPLLCACAQASPTLQGFDTAGQAGSDDGGSAGSAGSAGQAGGKAGGGGAAGAQAGGGGAPGGAAGAGGAQAGSGPGGAGQAGAGNGPGAGQAGEGQGGASQAGASQGGAGQSAAGQAGAGAGQGGSAQAGSGGEAGQSGGGQGGSVEPFGGGGSDQAGDGGGSQAGSGGSAQAGSGGSGQAGSSACEVCQSDALSGQCKNQNDACDNEPQCDQLNDCVAPCTTNACISDCTKKFPKGVTPLNNFVTCICDIACADSCATVCGNGGSGGSGGSGPDTCEHSVCEVGDALTYGCNDCVQAVCDVDDICCKQGWDGVCVGEASTLPSCGCLNGIQGCVASRGWKGINTNACGDCLTGTCGEAAQQVVNPQNCPTDRTDLCKQKCGGDNPCFCNCMTTGPVGTCNTAVDYFYACVGNNCKASCD